MNQIHKYGKSRHGYASQRGGLTIFSAALVLILMTMVMVYATRVSVFESRVSSNDVRQKEAFHVAESAIDEGMMYLLANASVLLSSREDAFGDGTTGSFTKDGWLSASGMRWKLCSEAVAAGEDMASHPCGGDVAAIAGAYYYETDNDTSTIESLPVNNQDFPGGTTANMSALLCFVELGTPIPCAGNPGSVAAEAEVSLLLTLLAYGYSDCTDTTDTTTCKGEATIAMPISNFRKLSGSPSVPLVSKSTTPLDGTFEIVGNPNGGGIGVPLTAWIDSTSGLLSSGSWQTCEMEEWYHTNELPDDVICSDNNCMCGPGGNDTAYFLSWRGPGGDTNIGIDIVLDPSFPPDLFELFFGVPRALYTHVKGGAVPVAAADCGDLGPDSKGLYWINGGDCNLTGNRVAAGQPLVIGSPLEPAVLVSAASNTILNGGVNLFGVLYLFDDDPAGSTVVLKATGGATVYGAVIVDAEIDKLQGTFQIVYNEDVLLAATGIAGLGSVNGGWRDFGLPDIAW